MKITLSRQSNSVLGTLANRVITTSKKTDYAVVNNNPLLTALETEYNAYKAVFGKQTFSGMGGAVEAADMARDAPFSGLKTILLGFAKLTGYEFQQDAIDLYSIFEQRGLDLNTYSYADESTEMEKLISELEKPENVLKLDHLHLTVQFGMLKAGQTEFERIYSQQTGANAELRQTQSASSIRKNLETALHNYLNVVEAMKNITGWKELQTELSEVVKAARNSKQDTKPVDPVAPAV